MKILFDHPSPFFLAHGGFQTQIEQTKRALEQIGIEVECVRWWDDGQTGDIIHYFGRPSGGYIHFAHQKGLKVVVAELHTGLGSRATSARRVQKLLMRFCKAVLPSSFLAKLAWDAYQKADAFVALTPWEATLMREMFNAPNEKIHVVPNGVEEVFFNSSGMATARKDYLICTATITERKRVLELAEAAVLAKTPILIAGKPYTEDDSYYRRFLLLAEKHPDLIRFRGPIQDRAELARIYREARGFVLLSAMESLSLSALEAAACGCPLLLSDLPWARSVFSEPTSFCPIASTSETAAALKQFYQRAEQLPRSQPPLKWVEVAQQLRAIYERLLNTSR